MNLKIAILILILGFFFGATLGIRLTEPEIITEYVYEEVIKEVEVIREIPIGLRQFESEAELVGWLEKDRVDSTFFFIGSTEFLGDCDDYALALISHARKDGYDIHLQFEKSYRCLDTGRIFKNHVLNLTIIDNGIYLIEPQTDEFWLVAYLD